MPPNEASARLSRFLVSPREADSQRRRYHVKFILVDSARSVPVMIFSNKYLPTAIQQKSSAVQKSFAVIECLRCNGLSCMCLKCLLFQGLSLEERTFQNLSKFSRMFKFKILHS